MMYSLPDTCIQSQNLLIAFAKSIGTLFEAFSGCHEVPVPIDVLLSKILLTTATDTKNLALILRGVLVDISHKRCGLLKLKKISRLNGGCIITR